MVAMTHDKIVSRYERSLELLADAVKSVDRAFIIDNSDDNNMILLAEKDDNELIVHGSKIPWWFERYLIDKLF